MDPTVSASVKQKLTDLFKIIAFSECDIERLRQVMAHMREFTQNQKALFEIMDVTKDGQIAPQELLEFMHTNLIKEATLEDVKEIINEFDASRDGNLTYDEFQNIFLPSADYNLRNIVYMPDPRLREGNGVPSSVLSMAARILEAERKFVSKRREARMELENVSEKDLLTVYQNIARYGGDVTVSDLINFLDQWGFRTTTEDLEAILRRCDHDATRSISFEEFAEILGRDYEKLLAEREAYYQKVNDEREKALKKAQEEQLAMRKEWEAKLVLEKLEREKRLQEWQLQQELLKKGAEERAILERIEREKRVQELQKEMERQKLEQEARYHQEVQEREQRLEQLRKEQELRRMEYEIKIQKELEERERQFQEAKIREEQRRKEHEAKLELDKIEREKRLEQAHMEREHRLQQEREEAIRRQAEYEIKTKEAQLMREKRYAELQQEQEQRRKELEVQRLQTERERELQVLQFRQDEERRNQERKLEEQKHKQAAHEFLIHYFKVYECQKTVEANQTLLQGFKQFSAKKLFNKLDADKNGFLTANELTQLQSEEVRDWDLQNLINFWTRGASKEQLDLQAFTNAFTGGRGSDRTSISVYSPTKDMRSSFEKAGAYHSGSPLRGHSSTNRSSAYYGREASGPAEELEEADESEFHCNDIVQNIVKASLIIADYYTLNQEAEEQEQDESLWVRLDKYKSGFIQTHEIKIWIEETVGFQLTDINILATYFGLNQGDTRVKKAVFLNAVKGQGNQNEESQQE